MRALRQDSFNVHDAVGGRRGVVETTVPGVLFVVVFGISRNLEASLWSALGASALFTVLRLARRESPQQALGGLVGVAVCAWWAHRSGRAADFYVPGFWVNAGYAAAYVVSIVLRYPVLGLILGPILGEGMRWRDDPRRLRAYTLASWLWVALFLTRLAVQLPLYQADMLGALATARLVMGLPLFALTLYVSWLILRPTMPARHHDGEPPAEEADEPGSGLGDDADERGAPQVPGGRQDAERD